MSNNKDYYYAEALIKVESPDPQFKSHYTWLLLQIDNNDEDVALEKAIGYMKSHYNRSYQGGAFINLSFIKILAINPAIENVEKEVMEIYSIPFSDIESFDKWKNHDSE